MDDIEIESIAAQIRDSIGTEMRGSSNPSESRKGLSFWFENYNRSNGPIFSIRPSGLKRHIVSLKFGPYAEPCINHIQNRATLDDYALAYALVDQLEGHFKVQINGALPIPLWKITPGFMISVTRVVANQRSSTDISESIRLTMIPLIAAIAELTGYDEEHGREEDSNADIEGSISSAYIKKRERSSRSRLLCLSIHGERCGLCGFVTKDTYGENLASILEVHHIEPLSEIEQPKAYDPKTDLIPLCPNCHRAIHKRVPAFTLEELGRVMKT